MREVAAGAAQDAAMYPLAPALVPGNTLAYRG